MSITRFYEWFRVESILANGRRASTLWKDEEEARQIFNIAASEPWPEIVAIELMAWNGRGLSLVDRHDRIDAGPTPSRFTPLGRPCATARSPRRKPRMPRPPRERRVTAEEQVDVQEESITADSQDRPVKRGWY
jgi:hypothetical protein